MKSYKIYILINLIAICSVTPFCTAQNNSNVPEKAKSSLQKGMEPVFDMYHRFLDTVMPYNFYDESNSPFSVQDIIDITKNDEYNKLQDEWQNLAKTFGGFAACIICGMLFIVFMPFVGCIYCCYSCCCHKCSCTREQNDPKHAKCKRVTYTSLLLIFTTLMLAGVIITFLGAELLHRSLKNEDDQGLMGGLEESLGHMQTFVNNTIKDIKREAQERIIVDALGGFLKSITETAITTVNQVQNVINATSLLNQAESIGTAAETALTDLQAINASLTTLTLLQTNVTTTLEKVKTDVNSGCSQVPCPSINISSLTFQPNFTALPALVDELSKVQEANNITGLVDQARQEFEKISSEVNSSVDDEIQEANKLIDDLTYTINKTLGNLDGSSRGFLDAMVDGKTFATEEEEQIRKIGNYIWYSCIGMACAVLLVVVFYYLGVLFGLCGERPSPHAACCNKGTGSNLLYTGICCSFIFCWLLMLVVLLTFTLGGLSYTMACKYLNDGVEHVDTFEDVVSEGFGWNISNAFNTTNLTIAGMFENCKNDQGVYTALNLKHRFDIDKQFDTSSIQTEVRKIVNTTNLNIGNITLLSADLRKQLEDFTTSNISTVNYTVYIVEIEKDLFGTNLTMVITEINQTANSVQSVNATAADILRNAASDLAVVRDVVQPAIQTEVQKLKESVTNLEQNSNVTAQVNSLITNIEKAETEFNNDRDQIVQEQLRTAAEGILTSIETTVNNTKDSIKYEIGKCRPLYDAAQSVVDSVCIVTLDPLNAIWFGLGWSLFFYIPSFIFAALLSSLYRRSEKYVPHLKPDFDDVAPYSGYDNGYLGGRQDEQYPLTRIDNGRSQQGGSHNYAYEGRDSDPDSRYHRDSHSVQPYYVGYPSQGAGRDSRGPTYAMPNAGSQDLYRGQEPVQPPKYDDVTSQGRRYGDHGGYPKLRNY